MSGRKLDVLWFGAAMDPSGYGEATRNYILGLDGLGVSVRLENRRFWNGAMPDLGGVAQRIARISSRPLSIGPGSRGMSIFNLTPENYDIVREMKVNACMTTFETDRIPRHWLLPIRAMDVVFTYSRFNMETFTDAGVNRPIIVIPHGVDVDRFSPSAPPMEAPRDRFIFGVNCEWTERKNIRNLIRAYYRAFEGNRDVLLMIKTYHQFPIEDSVQRIRGEIAKLKAEFPSGFKFPDIALVTRILSDSEMPGFYAAIDCYVMPTRGEGWSLTFTEAMASGLPVIATNWSGHTEFMDRDNSYLLDCELAKIKNSEVVNQPHYAGHRWAEVKVDHIAETMKGVYAARTAASEKGVRARKDMVEKWTWDMACRKLRDQMEALV